MSNMPVAISPSGSGNYSIRDVKEALSGTRIGVSERFVGVAAVEARREGVDVALVVQGYEVWLTARSDSAAAEIFQETHPQDKTNDEVFLFADLPFDVAEFEMEISHLGDLDGVWAGGWRRPGEMAPRRLSGDVTLVRPSVVQEQRFEVLKGRLDREATLDHAAALNYSEFPALPSTGTTSVGGTARPASRVTPTTAPSARR